MTNRITFDPRRLNGHRFATALALLAAAFGISGTAQAQSTEISPTEVALIEPLTITKLTDMDFGQLVVTTGGTVVLNPATSPTCTTTGGVVHIAECRPATFGGSGLTGERVRVRRPIGNIITLTGPGADMIVTDITIDGDPTLTHVQSNPNWERFLIGDPTGVFLFRVGGTLNVNPAQAPGVYTGTFEIRLDYQ